MVEKQWRAACKSESERSGGSVDGAALPYLPSDSELASSFAERKQRFVKMLIQGVESSLVSLDEFTQMFAYISAQTEHFCNNHMSKLHLHVVRLCMSDVDSLQEQSFAHQKLMLGICSLKLL